MAKREQFREGKLPKLWDYLVFLHKEHPDTFEDPKYLRAVVGNKWKALSDKTKCPNCLASMKEYIYDLDWHNARLLERMGEEVKRKLKNGVPFTEANAVHVTTLETSDAIRHRTTQTSKLGLIAKAPKKDAKGQIIYKKLKDGTKRYVHDREKGWVITARGFEALKGKLVPKEVTVYRKQIVERSDEKINIFEVLNSKENISASPDPEFWIKTAGYNKGQLL